MFFKLAKVKFNNFPCHYILNNGLILSTDEGWTQSGNVVSKGYELPGNKGNYCSFVCKDDVVVIDHDVDRSFPLWLCDNCITNLSACGEQIWADCKLEIDADLNATRKYTDLCKYDATHMTDDAIQKQLHSILCETFESFLTKNRLPLKIFLSGGIDTTTCWAYLDYFTKNYEIVDYEYLKFTKFYKNNMADIRQYWGYRVIHLWDEDCVLLTGGNGDENFLRGSHTLTMALKRFDIDLVDVLEPGDYHYNYLLKKQQDIEELYNQQADVNYYILNNLVNDHQHWHIDKTLTFTPFKNIDIAKLCLLASPELLVAQARFGQINRNLIKMTDSSKLDILSSQKNYNHLTELP